MGEGEKKRGGEEGGARAARARTHPMGHGRQSSEVTLELVPLYLPAAQGRHWEVPFTGANVPRLQGWQAEEPGTDEKVPAWHCAQALDSVVAPTAMPYFPATHVPKHSG